MKKMLSVFLVLVMLFTCAFSAVSLAETAETLTETQQSELAAALEWLMKDISEENYLQIFSWDKDTILEKLEEYDQPQGTITKEEIAEHLAPVFSMLSLIAGMAESEDGGKGIAEMMGGLFGGLMGGLSDESAGSFDWGIEWGGEDSDGIIASDFNGTFWENGDMTLEATYQDGHYSIVIYGVEPALFYQGELDPETWNVVSVSTGDPEMDKTQPDHGAATFSVPQEGVMIWKKADGEEVAFTQIIDPLDGSRWFGNEKLVTIEWLGFSNYEVKIEELGLTFVEWDYLCVLDEEKDVLDGSGQKTEYGSEVYADSPVTFEFRDGRTKLIWTDETEPAAKEGLTFEAVERVLGDSGIWEADDVTVFTSWLDKYYDVTVFMGEKVYEYLCTYDWETSTLTAVDPAAIDFDSLSLNLEKDSFISTATFVLETDDTLVWHDDSGLAGDGIALKHW